MSKSKKVIQPGKVLAKLLRIAAALPRTECVPESQYAAAMKTLEPFIGKRSAINRLATPLRRERGKVGPDIHVSRIEWMFFHALEFLKSEEIIEVSAEGACLVLGHMLNCINFYPASEHDFGHLWLNDNTSKRFGFKASLELSVADQDCLLMWLGMGAISRC